VFETWCTVLESSTDMLHKTHTPLHNNTRPVCVGCCKWFFGGGVGLVREIWFDSAVMSNRGKPPPRAHRLSYIGPEELARLMPVACTSPSLGGCLATTESRPHRPCTAVLAVGISHGATRAGSQTHRLKATALRHRGVLDLVTAAASSTNWDDKRLCSEWCRTSAHDAGM
jgi:hypothetical protein